MGVWQILWHCQIANHPCRTHCCHHILAECQRWQGQSVVPGMADLSKYLYVFTSYHSLPQEWIVLGKTMSRLVVDMKSCLSDKVFYCLLLHSVLDPVIRGTPPHTHTHLWGHMPVGNSTRTTLRVVNGTEPLHEDILPTLLTEIEVMLGPCVNRCSRVKSCDTKHDSNGPLSYRCHMTPLSSMRKRGSIIRWRQMNSGPT